MIKKRVKNALCVINANRMGEIHLHRNEWIFSDGLVIPIDYKGIKAIFIYNHHIFSHQMNIFRKILFDNNMIGVIGTDNIKNVLANAEEIDISIIDSIITIQGIEYIFNIFNYRTYSNDIYEFNCNKKEICYRPDYRYKAELAKLIVDGSSVISQKLNKNYRMSYDSSGRIWCCGFIFPKEIFQYYVDNIDLYLRLSQEYLTVLEKLIFETNEPTGLKELIIEHYAYTMMLTIISSHVFEELEKIKPYTEIDNLYNIFAINSPIGGDKETVVAAINKLRLALTGIQEKKSFFCVYSNVQCGLNYTEIIFFTNNMMSDIRRCTVNILREKSKWFNSIYTHRE